jgi:DNA-binding MarR family transcriptional regulator
VVDASSRSELRSQVIDLLLDVMEVMHGHFAERIAEFDLNPSLAMALRFLDTPTPQRDLAAALHCDPSHVTAIVDRLEDRGLVERRVDPVDRRVKNVVVTAAGRRLRSRLDARLAESAPVLEALTPGELETLQRLLAKMVTPPSERSAG